MRIVAEIPNPSAVTLDGVGTVASVGDGVTRVKVGDRVAACFMQDWVDGELTEAKGKSPSQTRWRRPWKNASGWSAIGGR